VKKSVTILFCVLFFSKIIFAQGTTTLTPEAVLHPGQWVSRHFAKGVKPPFSFLYGGKKSDEFIAGWQYRSRLLASTPDKDEYLFMYTDPESGLAVKCEISCFKDFPAVEWTLKFANTSGKNTPLIEEVKVVDHAFAASQAGDFILHYSIGSDSRKNDFEPADRKMPAGDRLYMTPAGGRSSDRTAFPFFNIEAPGGLGIVVAIGWTGKWYADVSRPSEQAVALSSGMERMQLALYPQEEIRTPRICLFFWKAEDRMAGHNAFRRFVLAHHSKRTGTPFAESPLLGSFDFGDPYPCSEYECLTESYAVAMVERYRYFNILPEVFWLDAGWYTGCGWNKKEGQWWQNVGNWTVDKERFPNGLRPVADAVHRAGAKFMVWFEPERVRPGTVFDREHPQWLLRLPGDDNSLFDLGNSEARLWLTGYMTEFIQREGIDYYRQDFNFDPYPYWQAKDRPGRIGMAEIRHIEGLYAYWDSLLVRFPELVIDNCASGGRRLDLETVSRSSIFTRTDYVGNQEGSQCATFGLNLYLPLHGTVLPHTDSYSFHSFLGSNAVTCWEITGTGSVKIPDVQKRLSEFKALRPYFYGDYYPLSDPRRYLNDDYWVAFQLNRPEQRDGIVLAFRRQDAWREIHKSISVRMSGLQDDKTYELFYEDFGLRIQKTGRELHEGFDITTPHVRESLLIRYHAIP
jgi:alpha-galactosidase